MTQDRSQAGLNGNARLSAAVAVVLLWALVPMVSFGNTFGLAAGETDAVYSMARILLNFTHVPTISQKKTLQGILDRNETTVAERVVAEALMNVEHFASPYDKHRLEALIKDESTPPAIKTLAIILDHLTHTPTETDKEKLRRLLQQICRGPVGCSVSR